MLTGAAHHVHAQKAVKHPISNEEWSRNYQPFRIAGNLYYVGTYDLAAYLITTPQGHILINTGLDDSEALIRAHINTLGFKFNDFSRRDENEDALGAAFDGSHGINCHPAHEGSRFATANG